MPRTGAGRWRGAGQQIERKRGTEIFVDPAFDRAGDVDMTRPRRSVRRAASALPAGQRGKGCHRRMAIRSPAARAARVRSGRTDWYPRDRSPRRSHVPACRPASRSRPHPGRVPWNRIPSPRPASAPAQKIVVKMDTAVRSAAALFAATDVDTLRAYLTFHYINEFAPLLSAEWENASFAFYGTRLGGIAQPEAPKPQNPDIQLEDFSGNIKK